MRLIACALSFCLAGSAAFAAPADASCRVLAVIGGNDATAIAPMMTEFADRWTDANRTGAIESLTSMVTPEPFAGGAVYRIAKFGEDLEEHLIVLRLATGEVAGMRLLYEWTPDGLQLTTMDFKRRFPDMIATQILMPPEPIDCS